MQSLASLWSTTHIRSSRHLHEGLAHLAIAGFMNYLLKVVGKKLANTLANCLQCNCQPQVAWEATPRVALRASP